MLMVFYMRSNTIYLKNNNSYNRLVVISIDDDFVKQSSHLFLFGYCKITDNENQ